MSAIDAVLLFIILAQFCLLAYAGHLLDKSQVRAARERRELEDRFMSITQPLALTHVDAVRRQDDEPARVTYVDEREELRLEQELEDARR